MHAEAFSFVQRATIAMLPERVVELGSRDVNGSPRSLFPYARYLGVDIEPGPGVDVVADASEWVPDCEYDLVLCLEVFEHTPHWPGIIRTAHNALRDGGTFIVTAATEPRAEHSAVDGGPLQPDEYYENLDPHGLGDVLWSAGFGDIKITVCHWGDVYAVGVR